MRSLFYKLFFSFILAMVMAGALSTLFIYTISRGPFESFRENLSRDYEESIARFILISGQAAHDTYRYSGIEAYRAYVREFEAGTETHLILIAEDGKGLLGALVPAELGTMVKAAQDGKGVQVGNRDGQLLVAGMLQSRDGDHFVVAGLHRKGPPPGLHGPLSTSPGPRPPMPAPPPGMPNGPPGGIFPFVLSGGGPDRLIIMILVAAGVCLLLARSFSAPLAKLRRVTRQIAAGDFSARVGDNLGKAADEIVQLGRDFDTMAAATEKMILSRQRLLRDISHELRSPLARLNVALELARQRFDSRDDQALATIEKESDRLNELIGDLLSLTRLEDGEGGGEKERIDLWELVLQIVEDANFEVGKTERGVKVVSLEDLQIDGSPELVRRAIENVVRNAARYTAPHTEAEISLGQREGMAVIQVSDHGPGVPAEELEALFRPFYRVAAARDRQSGGAGLGLAIAAQAVKWHGGSIEAANGQTGGLMVTISLPLSASATVELWEKERQSGIATG
ncbi:MAG: ATP-binding protein [Desulfoprunum sp.]|nr:ATP-binding protein [Desulfoprunum sp.]